jgi:hypothetical protein
MRHRFTIAGLLVSILFFAIVFAGLRSGSNDWCKLIYSFTFVTLVYAAIAARYRSAFWYGFAVAGWAYFIVAFGPWIGVPPVSEPVNRSLITSFVHEVVVGELARSDPPPFATGFDDVLKANREGIFHCALTVLFALLGGSVARVLARPRPQRDG